ncbi:MAG: minichromosome maintenance protein MCM [Methanosphaera stadtmanae]|nr:minichromosome maintenance protein MCM [Methanosphaera stadtmanae]
MNISINNISAEQIGESLEFEGKIIKVEDSTPLVIKGSYKCLDCMETYTVINNKINDKYTPDVCLDCGSNKIKFMPNQSKYIDSQELLVEDTEDFVDKYSRKRKPRIIKCVVYGNDVNQHIENDNVIINGVLNVTIKKEMFIEVTDINLLENI